MLTRSSVPQDAAMTVRSTIMALIVEIAGQQKKSLAPLTDDLLLLESGLDSLCIAVLVARLEEHLDYDPFSDLDSDRLPVTLGDFVALYEHAAA